MAHIQVYYRDMLKDEVELQSEVTTIGRSFDSDVKIDNAGVSAHHAKIIRQGDDFIIEDIGSRNGIYVNGKRVARQSLSDGDEVTSTPPTDPNVGILGAPLEGDGSCGSGGQAPLAWVLVFVAAMPFIRRRRSAQAK